MNKQKVIFFYSLLVIVILVQGCSDLSVDNLNDPDTERALANPSDIESLVGNQYLQWWSGTQSRPINDRLTIIGLESTNGYSFVSDYGKIPREPFNNSPTYRFRQIVTTPWSDLYTAISSASDGLAATDIRGLELDSESDTQRMRAFAKFIQGISYAALANHFDKAVLIDENTNLNEVEFEFEPYEDIFAFALEKLDEARTIAEQHSFTLPSSWIRGNALSSAEFVRLINSYEARYTLQNCRTVECRSNIDWSAIKTLVENGIESDLVIDSDGNRWGDSVGILQGTIFRTNYFLIGHTDQSGNFDAWRNAPPEDRHEFILDTPDKRIAGQQDVIGEDANGNSATLEAGQRAPGTDFRWIGPAPWPVTNGAWYGSQYMPIRTEAVWLNGGVGDIYHMRKTEMDMYLTEALLRESEPNVDQQAVDLINKTRVERGGLNPIAVTDDFDDVWNAMRYEFDIETTVTAAGLAYYHKRGLGDYRGLDYGGLIEGTPIHFPVPAEELDLLEMPHYTFGGVGGEGAAP